MSLVSKLGLTLAALALTVGTASAQCSSSKLVTASKPVKPLTVATLTPPAVPAPTTVAE